MMPIGVVLALTCYRLVLFAATVAQNKLSKLCRLRSRIFPRIYLHKENERSIGKTNKYKIWIVDKDYGLALLSAHSLKYQIMKHKMKMNKWQHGA